MKETWRKTVLDLVLKRLDYLLGYYLSWWYHFYNNIKLLCILAQLLPAVQYLLFSIFSQMDHYQLLSNSLYHHFYHLLLIWCNVINFFWSMWNAYRRTKERVSDKMASLNIIQNSRSCIFIIIIGYRRRTRSIFDI